MAITISSGYSVYNNIIRTGNDKVSGTRKVFVGTNTIGTGGVYDSSAVAGYVKDSNGVEHGITNIYIGNTCVWSRGSQGTVVEYAELYYKFYRNGVGEIGTADSVTGYKAGFMTPPSGAIAIGVYIRPIRSGVTVKLYKNGVQLTAMPQGSLGSSANFYDNGNIVDANIAPGVAGSQPESIFGGRDPYVFKFQYATSSSSSSSGSSGGTNAYTFKVFYNGSVIATMDVNLEGHDYNGYT